MSTTQGAEIRLCLSMIVKNEGRVIDRCLDSALPLVQGYVIVDTGSTDDTRERIKAAGKRHGVPGVVVDDGWKDFGWNRTRAAESTRRWVKEKNWKLAKTYMLLLDADMVLRAMPSFERQALSAVYYQLEQRSPNLSWLNTRLCRLSHEWRAIGVTHEYWAPAPNADPVRLDSLYIQDIGDGGAKGDKTARDIRLLSQGLVDEPGNVRYLFYLAQSYFDIGNYITALPLYEQRHAYGGWAEETWYCLFKMGLCCLRLDNESEGVGYLLRAHEERPGRAEPLAYLARHYREKGWNNLALLFARQAARIAMSTDGLFVETPAHFAMPLEDVAISAYYTTDKAEGAEAAEKLLSSHAATHLHDHIARCASFYVKTISPLAVRKGDFNVAESIRKAPEKFFGLEEPNTTEYLCSNPTIISWDDFTIVNVRLVNYYHERGRVFASKDPDGVIRTRNVIQNWDYENDIVIGEKESTVVLPAEWDHTTRVRGLEDQRWAAHNGRVWLTSTCFNIPGAGGMPRVILGRVSEDISHIEHVVELKFSGSRHYEKNWLPWSRNGEFVLVYGYSPFVILNVDTETGECTVKSATPPPFPTQRWRGSAGPVRLPGEDRWLLMIHETAWFEGEQARDQRTVYMHRFVEVIGDRVTRKSRLFTFDHSGVEYAAGLLILGSRVFVTHSIEESSAHWKEFHLDTIEALLAGEPL